MAGPRRKGFDFLLDIILLKIEFNFLSGPKHVLFAWGSDRQIRKTTKVITRINVLITQFAASPKAVLVAFKEDSLGSYCFSIGLVIVSLIIAERFLRK